MNKIIEAARFADEAHRGQTRKWSSDPYVHHPLRVMGRVMLLNGIDGLEITEDHVIAAVLHDVVEDTEVKLEEIQTRFGERVGLTVYDLTNQFTPELFPELNRAARKTREHERLSRLPKETRAIKLVDRIDNLSDFNSPPDFAEHYATESESLLEAICLGLHTLSAELSRTIVALRLEAREKRIRGHLFSEH